MKLIHLSDLHLGRRFEDHSLLEDQRHILDQILCILRSEQPDAVLICGDVYDKSVPSAEAVELLDEFLYSLSRLELQVFLISGNHDSPERLAFGGRLMDRAGIHLSPVYDGQVTPISLQDAHGEVNFYMLPFLKPTHIRQHFPDETVESYNDAVRIAIGQMGIDPARRNVLLSHQYVAGAQTCESEELSVGGLDKVDASLFEAFDYVALGHIHGPQNITDRIRYCGTPLKYSFSEAKHVKTVTVVELEEKGRLSLREVPLKPLRDMRCIRGTFEALTARSYYETTVTDDYLHITLTDEEDVPEAIGRLRVIYPNLLSLEYDNTRTRNSALPDSLENIQNKSPLELFCELYEKQNGKPMSDVQLQYLAALIESVEEDAQ